MSAMRGAPDIKSSNTMRLTDDKVNKLAHTVADTLAEIDGVSTSSKTATPSARKPVKPSTKAVCSKR